MSNQAGETNVTREREYIADFCAQYRVLMVYTDTIESQAVGDILTSLLRIVNADGNNGEMVSAQ